MTHHENVRDAVSEASLGQEPLTIKELANAIVVGLSPWGNHEKNILKLLREIAKHSQEPLVVINRADEHK